MAKIIRVKKLSEAKKWFKERLSYPELIAGKGNVNIAIQMDLAKIIPLVDSEEAKEYLRIIYIDLIAELKILTNYPEFISLPKEKQREIINKKSQKSKEEAKNHKDIW
jgi:hypothetical protein